MPENDDLESDHWGGDWGEFGDPFDHNPDPEPTKHEKMMQQQLLRIVPRNIPKGQNYADDAKS
jgi:hypothetical protein